jgi:PAS domain S-box-containing protein
MSAREQRHSLLRRQLRRFFGTEPHIPESCQGFVAAVDDAYRQSDTDRGMLERALELSSQELLQANSELRAIFRAIPDLMFRLDGEGTILAYEAGHTSYFLVEPKELVGKRIQDVPLPRVGQAFGEAIRQVRDTRTTASLEYSMVIQGEEHSYEARLLPLLENQIVAIIRNITERKRAEEEQEKLIEELDAFAHTVAHDLKNPLTSILGHAEALQLGDFLPQDQVQSSLEAIQRGARKMGNIVDELLLLADVRRMREVRIEPLDMGEIVAGALERLDDMVDELRAEVRLPDVWLGALGYAPWVEEVWVNYLSNGLKYGSRPPHLEVGASQQGAELTRFWVRDDGPGLSGQQQARLFTPFTRLDQISATGHGLGLSIVRRIVSRLGGRVAVESELGRGSVFSFSLPASPSRL